MKKIYDFERSKMMTWMKVTGLLICFQCTLLLLYKNIRFNHEPENENDKPISVGFENLKLPKIYPKHLYKIQSNATGLPHTMKKKASIIFGISSSPRNTTSYLIDTLTGLFSDKNAKSGRYIFVLMISTFNVNYILDIQNRLRVGFQNEIKKGLLRVFTPHGKYYPEYIHKPFTENKTEDYFKWRAKQNLDFAYLFTYVYETLSFDYYMHLEDDILTTRDYINKIETFMGKLSRNKSWTHVNFCQLGFIGKLFKKEDVQKMASLFLIFYDKIPVDWLLDFKTMGDTLPCSKSGTLFGARTKDCMNKRVPFIGNSLFQHVGVQSSLLGKIQTLKEYSFQAKRK